MSLLGLPRPVTPDPLAAGVVKLGVGGRRHLCPALLVDVGPAARGERHGRRELRLHRPARLSCTTRRQAVPARRIVPARRVAPATGKCYQGLPPRSPPPGRPAADPAAAPSHWPTPWSCGTTHCPPRCGNNCVVRQGRHSIDQRTPKLAHEQERRTCSCVTGVSPARQGAILTASLLAAQLALPLLQSPCPILLPLELRIEKGRRSVAARVSLSRLELGTHLLGDQRKTPGAGRLALHPSPRGIKPCR